jgi:hypothetical protein
VEVGAQEPVFLLDPTDTDTYAKSEPSAAEVVEGRGLLASRIGSRCGRTITEVAG